MLLLFGKQGASGWTASLLPRNRTAWEGVVEGVDADLVARDPTGLIPAARRAYSSPIELLPYLASERSVDEFSSSWDQGKQRAVVDGSFAYHRVKGTRPALDKALSQLGHSIKVTEWFENNPPRPAYTFRISVTLGNLEVWLKDDHDQIVRVANRAKNAHTKIEFFEIIRVAPTSAVYAGGRPRTNRTITIREVLRPITIPTPDCYVYCGVAMHRNRTVHLLAH